MAEEKAQLKDEELEKVTGGAGQPADQQTLKDLKELEQYVLSCKGR